MQRAREGAGTEVGSAAAFWDRGREARGPHLGDRVVELLGVGDVVAPNPDDLRARREEPLRRRSGSHGRQGWWTGGGEEGSGGDGEANGLLLTSE